MRRTTRSTEVTTIDFSNFSGGINLITAPENIEQNELAECVNMTYSSQPGRLRTRDGIGMPVVTYPSDITSLYWYEKGKVLLASSGTTLYEIKPQEKAIGTLSGTSAPYYCEFGDELFIASGGKIQKFNPLSSTLETVSGSPSLHGLYSRAGRLYGWNESSDTISGSGVGDPLNWTVPDSPTDADPVEVQIGYKVAGNIVGCYPSMTDVIVFKEHATFRLIDEYPDWSIKEVSRDEALANGHSAVIVGGVLYYLEKSKGMRVLKGSDEYSQILPSDTLKKVNPWVRGSLDNKTCRLWNLPARNILLVSPGGRKVLPAYYEYDSMPALQWEFHDNVNGICEPDRNTLYIAVGKSVFNFSGVSAFDIDENGELGLVSCRFSTKKFLSFNEYLLKRLSINAASLDVLSTDEKLNVFVNDTRLLSISFFRDESPYVYGNLEIVHESSMEFGSTFSMRQDFAKHNLYRTPTLQVSFVSKGAPYELTRFSLEVCGVGVTA